MGCGIFFDVQRSIRRVLSAGKIRTLLEDFFFGIVCTAGAIATGFLFNRGQMRYYQVMGLVSGVLFYAAFLSPFMMKFLTVMYSLLRKYVIKPATVIIRFIFLPFCKICLFLKKKYGRIKVNILKITRVLKLKRKTTKKRMKML